MKQFHKLRTELLLLVLLVANLGTFAQTTVTLPTACNTCPPTTSPCTTPTALTCENAVTITAGGTATSTVTGGTGGTITWGITPTTGVSTTSGTGSTTGAITFSTAGSYTVTFTSTNNTSPASCSPAASVTCTRTITVNSAPSGSVTAFNCATAIPSPASYNPLGAAYTGTVTLSYTGGNGGSYAAGSVASTGITGFTASWAAGTLATGAGSITINISGSSTTWGTPTFAITIAGQSCTFKLYSCGAYVSAGVWKEFLCHNLGADITLDPSVPVVGLQGAYIQWGKRGPNITGDSRIDWQTAPNDGPLGFVAAPTATNPNNPGSITGWQQNEAANYAWRTTGGAKTAADPCPTGYRVPTQTEWTGVSNNNTVSRVGTWTTSITNYGSMLYWGPNATTKTLPMPAAGYYTSTAGGPATRGYLGVYWTSTEVLDNINAYEYGFDGTTVYTSSADYVRRAFANSIRCIAE